MSLQAFITTVVGMSVANVTTTYDTDAIPESLAKSALPAMLPGLPIKAGSGEQQPVVMNTALTNAFEATYEVEFVIFIRQLGSAPPPTYVREQVDFFDAFLAAIRTNDQSFVGAVAVLAPSAGILNYAGQDYVAVVIAVRFTENVDG